MPYFYRFRNNILEKANKVWAPGYTLDSATWDPEAQPPDEWFFLEDDDAAYAHFGLTPPERIPVREVSRFRVRAALYQMGILDQVDQFVEQNADPIIKLAWKEGTGFSPDSQVVRQMAAAFGLSDQDVENIFQLARSIEIP